MQKITKMRYSNIVRHGHVNTQTKKDTVMPGKMQNCKNPLRKGMKKYKILHSKSFSLKKAGHDRAERSKKMSNIYNNTTEQEQVEAQKDMRTIQRKAAEKKIEHDSELDLEIQKVYLDDAKRELRRSQYSELLMNQEGRFVAVTRNLLIPSKERAALNLQAPVLERCLSYKGKGGICKLMVTIDQTKQELYLNQRKCGNVKYLLEKISVIGGTVYGKKSQVESYIQQFWHYCLAHCVAEPVYYPDDYGWNLTGKDEVVFVREGDVLWKDLLRMAE